MTAYQPISNLNPTAPNYGLNAPGLNPPQGYLSGLLNPTPSTGVKAKSPDQNIVPKSKVLPQSQTASVMNGASSGHTPFTPGPDTNAAGTEEFAQFPKSQQTADVINSLPAGGGTQSPSGGGATTQTPASTGATATTGTPATPNTGLYGQTQNPSYPGIVSTLTGMATNGSPEVNEAQNELTNLQKNYAYQSAAIQNDPNYSLDTQQGRAQVLNSLYGNLIGAAQTKLSTAQTQQGQQLGGLGTAASASAPHWNGYAGLNPYNNQPIGDTTAGGAGTSGGTGGSNLNSIATWGAGIDYASSAATQVKNNDVSISTARSQGQTLLQQLQQDPTYNANPVNIWNTIASDIQQNISNPQYANIETSVKNVLSQYANVLGVDPTTLLIQGAQAPSLGAFLTNLDT